tara:strand:+ start:15379 stop:16533 length:1155 start_codon:yes stop_codon:yes gene_type:complete
MTKFYFYLTLPVFIQLALVLLFFYIPPEMYLSLLFLPCTFFFCALFCNFFTTKKIALSDAIGNQLYNLEMKVFLFFCFFVILLIPLDIYFNGFKLIKPWTYAEFHGVGRYIRHITNFSWLLCLFGALFFKNGFRFKFILFVGLITPIIFIDRNRLLMGLFSVFIIWYYSGSTNLQRFKKNLQALVFLIFIGLIFSLIGSARSGTGFFVPSSGEYLVNGYFPLNNLFYYLPLGIQQIVLYITTPLFNFAHMIYLDFSSDVFLLKQLSFLSRDSFPHYPFSPVLVARYNVGTEFFPILLYGGKFAVFISLLSCSIFFLFFVRLINKKPNFITLALFIKCAYTTLLLGFAPQFFIVYNFVSLFFMLAIYFSVILLCNLLKPFVIKSY